MPNIAAHALQSYNFHIFLTVLGQMLGQPNCASPVYVPARHASWHICSSCVTIELKIAKFRGTKHIDALEAFPLQYHTEAATYRADLLECGRKFMSLRGTHHRCCNGSAFYVRDGEQVEVCIDSRIMVDAAYFRKMNPNYFRLTVLDLDHRFNLSAY